ncbi:MAG: DUF4080 domain-containing protein [Candidatus Izemoplasmatales bacterium]|nr:DUF4080 domain-containing protein [Candidatus Izemoplasmatales bacterium]
MKILLVGINSKFIHPNMAIRYLKSNCDFDVEIKEYTIKDDLPAIIDAILTYEVDIIGFSCYIWNIQIIIEITKFLRENNFNQKIVFGGPETSYEYDEYLNKKYADYIIINEGEISFNKLINALYSNLDLDTIPNLAFVKDNKIQRNPTHVIKDLNKLKSPYYLSEDIIDIPKKIQYVELSRGCPYKCSYCLASLEKGIRFFDIEKVIKTIDYLILNGAKTIKFLDRSFNANKKIALEFFKILIEKDYSNTVFQFEINGDVLQDEIIDYLINNLKKNYIRFELGIQSTNLLINESINRYQDTEKLINNIKKLQISNVILHLDLIAGLPYENLDSFKNTFNEIFVLFSEELQLGFLKMLKGTKIRDEAALHGYIYDSKPPYEIQSNKYINADELRDIHIVETFLEIYWNKGFMNETMKLIISKYKSPFDFFFDLGNYFRQNKITNKKYQLYDLFINMQSFLISRNLYTENLADKLKLDYLSYNKIKPKIFWKNDFKKQNIIREFFKLNQDHKLDDLYKYTLVTKYQEGYLLVLYLPNKINMYYYFNNQTKRIS